MRDDARAQLRSPPLPDSLAIAADAPLFGRDAALADARDALDARRLLFLEGPPGIGKTHLAAVLARSAHIGGTTVLLARGRNVWPGPFAALAGALRPVVLHNDPDAVRQGLGNFADELVALFPGLATAEANPERVDGRLGADAERFRNFEAICALLDLADTGAGTVLVVDDAQSLDPSSLQLISQIVITEAVPDLKLIVTGRPESKGTATLVEASGSGRALTLTLEPLDHRAIRQMVRHARPGLGGDATIELTADLLARTGGTPLLVGAALAAGGRPEDLQTAVAALVSWAGDDVEPLLRAAALDDAGAGVDVLAVAADLPLDRAVLALDRARRAGLLASGTDVVHASVREALVADLGSAERAALHRRLAQAHEETDAAPARIAAHWGRGETADARSRAAVWEQRAAERALALLAAEDAVSHAERALAHLGGADPVRGVELTALCGRAHNAASRLADGFAAMREAQQRARALGRRDLVAQIAADAAGHRLGTAVVDPELVSLIEEGLAATTSHDGALRSRLAGRLAGLLLSGPLARREALIDEAITLARASGDPGTTAEVLLHAHTASVFRGDPDGRAALVDEATVLARSAGRPELALHARMLRTSDRLEAVALDAARRELQDWATDATAARVPYNRWAQAMARPSFEMLDGRLDRAETSLRAADALAITLGDDPVVQAASASQWLSLGLASGRAEEVGQGISAYVAQSATTPGWSAALAYCAAMAGDRPTALRLLDEMLDSGLEVIVDPNRAAALSFAADAAVIAGASEPVLRALDHALQERAGTLIVQHYCGAPHGLADARRARLAAALGDAARASDLTAAAATSAGSDAPPLLAVDVGFARATALLAAGDTTATARLEATVREARAHGLLGLSRNLEVFAATQAANRGGPRLGVTGRTLLEREAQLVRIDELIAGAGDGKGGVISIEGVAGIGKTELLREACERASRAGLNVLSARGGELERDMAFGVARQLLELAVVGGSDDEQAALLDGAAELARGALGLAGGHAAPSDQFAVVHGLYWVCSNLCDSGPLMLAVDDAHWGDVQSLRWLAYLARRVEDLPIFVVLATRPDEAGAAQEVVRAMVVEHAAEPLPLAPLGVEAVGQVVHDRFESADGAFCVACHDASGGNPLLLRELLLAMGEDGLSGSADEAARAEGFASAKRLALRTRTACTPGGHGGVDCASRCGARCRWRPARAIRAPCRRGPRRRNAPRRRLTRRRHPAR